VLFLLFSTTVVPPAIVSLLYDDGGFEHFFLMFVLSLIIGLGLWLPLRRKPYVIRNRDGFVIVALMWVAMSLLGSLPFVLGLDMGFADALFESASGYTTTGSTVIIGLDDLPKSILFYRQEIQWVGGIGVIVLAVALMPMLGVGGMQLYKAEIPGPVKDERLTPRIAKTARTLCVLYFGMTIACAVCYWLAGMGAFDAISHSLTTLSSGGFSTHDASIAFFDSTAIEAVAIIFMLLAGISFSVHFIVWRGLHIDKYFRDDQARAFLVVVAVLIALVTSILLYFDSVQSLSEAFRQAAFAVVSVITSTGYGIADFSVWPVALPIILIFSSFMGGCSGSTSGGIKVIRFLVLAKQTGRQIFQLIHPHAVRPIRVNRYVVPDTVIEGVSSFFTIYVIVFGVFMLLLMMNGMDQVTAFGAVATCMNNLGPGLGDVAANFASVSDESKILLVFAMLLGRLEIYTLLVLVTPSFWRN
jgi:trk system potassium uptake protein TrkH